MSATRNQLRCSNGTSKELPTTGLRTRGLALLSMIDGYLKIYLRNQKCYPPAISLNQKQWNVLTKSTQLTGLELNELTYRGIRFHLIEESPETGRPGNTPQF
jgi:N-acetylneuraminic acid mutarotase